MHFGLYEARLLWSAVTGDHKILPKRLQPHVATINLTENCQSRCRMCDYWRTSKPSPITEERAARLVEELREAGVGTLRFLGGEPLLRKDLFAVLEHAAPLGFERIVLATNGLLLDRFASEVNRSCITNLTVSIDGLADTNDAIRGAPGYFERVMRNLTLIHNKRIKLATLLSDQLAADIHGLIAICRSRDYLLDVNLPSFDLPYASSPAAREGIRSLWPSEESVETVLRALVEAGYLTSSLADGCREYLTHRRYPMHHCLHGYVSLLIRSNGDLTLGCYQKKPLGNILEQPLSTILVASLVRAEARSMFELDCERCVCGWAISYVLAHPVPNATYAFRRVDPRPLTERGPGRVPLPVLVHPDPAQ